MAGTNDAAVVLLGKICRDAVWAIVDECRRGVYSIRHPSTDETSLLDPDTGVYNDRVISGASLWQSAIGCGAPISDVLRRQAEAILRAADTDSDDNDDDDNKDRWRIHHRLADLTALAHAHFYAHPADQIPVCWRQLYTDTAILEVVAQWLLRCAKTAPGHRRIPTVDALDRLVHPLDRALILAGGAGPPQLLSLDTDDDMGQRRGAPWIHAALDALQTVWDVEQTGHGVDNVRDWSACSTFDDLATATVFVPPVRHPVACSSPLGAVGFQAYLDRHRSWGPQGQTAASEDGLSPLLLHGMVDDWPALWRHRPSFCEGDPETTPDMCHPWAVPAYLRWRALDGRRLVPVEAGRSYVDEHWTQALVPFDDVLAALQGGEKTNRNANGHRRLPDPLYLAQHMLFAQMPHLRRDIRVPDACYTSSSSRANGDDSDDDDEIATHAWLGPAGTITPLHTDPSHNLLVQVVGRKYVRLYAPRHTPTLRPEAGLIGYGMSNTSLLDVGVLEGWDADDADAVDATQKAAFHSLPYVDCILTPGDTLFIPLGWWHYVRSLSTSFSVSFWWDRERPFRDGTTSVPET